jgi:hypothetical protein
VTEDAQDHPKVQVRWRLRSASLGNVLDVCNLLGRVALGLGGVALVPFTRLAAIVDEHLDSDLGDDEEE